MSRAKPLAPHERRQAIVESATPLILEQGAQVTTRQIADVCGLAEGTLFRAFANKDAIVRAVCSTVLDPEPLLAEIGAIDLSLPLRERIVEMLRVVTRSTRAVRTLMAAFHMGRMGDTAARDPQADHRFMLERRARVVAAMARVLEPDAARLRLSTAAAASFVQLSVVAASMQHMLEPPLDDPAVVADLLYHAITKDTDEI